MCQTSDCLLTAFLLNVSKHVVDFFFRFKLWYLASNVEKSRLSVLGGNSHFHWSCLASPIHCFNWHSELPLSLHNNAIGQCVNLIWNLVGFFIVVLINYLTHFMIPLSWSVMEAALFILCAVAETFSGPGSDCRSSWCCMPATYWNSAFKKVMSWILIVNKQETDLYF